MAAAAGFEPTNLGSEPSVLPLDYAAIFDWPECCVMIQTAVFILDEDVFFFGLNFRDLNRRNEFVEKEFLCVDFVTDTELFGLSVCHTVLQGYEFLWSW